MKPGNILSIISLASVILFSGYSFAETPKKADNFKLKDYNGREVQLSDFSKSNAVVLMFIATQCPVSNAYNERMEQLSRDYKDKNITFVGINSNNPESIAEIKKHSEEHGFTFPVLKDEQNIIADKFGASFTPEIYLVDRNMQIVYHGRIDDSRRESDVKEKDLRNALDALLAGKKIPVTETKAFGCSIKRVNK